jgi:hypothetical protein
MKSKCAEDDVIRYNGHEILDIRETEQEYREYLSVFAESVT